MPLRPSQSKAKSGDNLVKSEQLQGLLAREASVKTQGRGMHPIFPATGSMITPAIRLHVQVQKESGSLQIIIRRQMVLRTISSGFCRCGGGCQAKDARPCLPRKKSACPWIVAENLRSVAACKTPCKRAAS